MKRRVLHVDPETAFGGGEAQVEALLAELAARGWECWLAAPPEGALARRLSDASALVPLRCRFAHDPRAGFALRRAVARFGPDLVHLHTARALTLAPYLPRGLARIVTRRMDYAPRGARAYVAWLYRSVDGVIAISDAARDALVARGVPRARIELVPSGVDPLRFADLDREAARRALGVDVRRPIVAAVGSLVRRKGFDVLLDALVELRSRISEPLLLIAGEGPERERLRSRAKRLGVAEACRWLGRLDDVGPVLAAADVVAAPSRAEGLGVAAIEAMAAARPVVASAVGGLAELIRSGREGLLVAPDDPVALAAALADVLADRARARRLGAAARERAHAFSAAAMARGTEAVYERALAARQARRAGR